MLLAINVAMDYFYPLLAATVVFAATLVCSFYMFKFIMLIEHQIFHTLQRYQSGAQVDIQFTRAKYRSEYEALEQFILEWTEKRPERWDALSKELGCAALCVLN